MKFWLNLAVIRKNAILFSAFIIILSSCHKETENALTSKNKSSITEEKLDFKFQGTPTILGKKLENPYAIEVMRRAYNEIRPESPNLTNRGSDSLTIRVTHLYVRFLPTSWAMFDSLKKDKTFELYDRPLDYEVISSGDYYHDPTIPEGSPTWQYASVPVNHTLRSDMRHEVLSQLYIPEEDNSISGNHFNAMSSSNSNSNANIERLVDRAIELATNKSSKGGKSTGKIAGYTPSGTIRVANQPVGGFIPVEGVKIRMRQ